MNEEEAREALAILRAMAARLEAMQADMRNIQRSMTMIELHLGVMDAVAEAREAGRAGLPDDTPEP
jgi:hypothetical protein